MRYDDFVQRVRRFHRTSLIRTTARLLWRIWDRRLDESTDRHDIFLLKSFGARLAAIAAACGNDFRRAEATPQDITRLAHDLLELDTALLDESFRNQEMLELGVAWRTSETFRGYPLDERGLEVAWFTTTAGRMIRSQWHMRYVQRDGMLRTWELIRRLRRRADCTEVESYLARALRVEPAGFMRAGFTLLAFLSASGGECDLRGMNLHASVSSRFSIDMDVLLLVAERLSIHPDDLARWHSRDVLALPDPYRRFAPNPLGSLPAIQLDRPSAAPVQARGHYIAPSPWYATIALQSTCLDVLREPSRRSVQGYSVELGQVLEDYLFDFFSGICGPDYVFRIDAISSRPAKHADLIVVMGSRALIVECKSLLGSGYAKAVAAPADAISVWERIHRAYAQCGTTLADTQLWNSRPALSRVTERACVACFDEQICIQGPAFNSVALQAGITSALGVSRIETITLQELEGLVLSLGPDGLFEAIKAKWNAGKAADELTAFTHNNLAACEPRFVRPPAHLASASAEVFPGVDATAA